MEKKQSSSSSSFFFFKRLNRKATAAGGGDGESGGGPSGGSWRWKYLKASSTGLRWKRRFNLHLWLVDGVLFKIVSVFEAIVLVSTLCAFFVCCGCHF